MAGGFSVYCWADAHEPGGEAWSEAAVTTTTITLTKQVNEDFQCLAQEAVKCASYLLERNQSFLPVVFYLKADGEVAVADFTGQDELAAPPDALDYLALAQAALRPLALAGEIRATALACDVRMKMAPEEVATDAIRVDLEHRDGGSLSYLQPYALETGEVALGQGICQAQTPVIFAPELDGRKADVSPTSTDTQDALNHG